MSNEIHDWMKVGIVQFMIYPECISGGGPIVETVTELANNPFFDFLGDDLGFALTPTLSDGSITIIEPTNVPEPSTLLLLSAGLIIAGLSARRNRSS